MVKVAADFDCTVGLLSEAVNDDTLPVLNPLTAKASVVTPTTLFKESAITTLKDYVGLTIIGLRT